MRAVKLAYQIRKYTVNSNFGILGKTLITKLEIYCNAACQMYNNLSCHKIELKF